jgi:hypothetical protein
VNLSNKSFTRAGIEFIDENGVVRGSVPANVDGPINMTKSLVEIDAADTAAGAQSKRPNLPPSPVSILDFALTPLCAKGENAVAEGKRLVSRLCLSRWDQGVLLCNGRR